MTTCFVGKLPKGSAAAEETRGAGDFRNVLGTFMADTWSCRSNARKKVIKMRRRGAIWLAWGYLRDLAGARHPDLATARQERRCPAPRTGRACIRLPAAAHWDGHSLLPTGRANRLPAAA